VAADGELSWLSAGRFVSVYGEDLMAADISGGWNRWVTAIGWCCRAPSQAGMVGPKRWR
jgi:hypothetical protein